ncbi:Hypothetical predicted protein, partial [Mytilus galloprovincialis]
MKQPLCEEVTLLHGHIYVTSARVLGDTFGNFTCYTPNGASVVDYVAVSEEILENVLYFKVSRFIPTLSDCHCKLEWELSAKYCVPGENDIPIQLKNMTPNYIWTDCSAIKFQETLSSDTLQNYILEFNNSTIQFTQTSVDEASSKLSNIFLSAANLSLKRPLKKHTNKQKNKKWFDASLQQARTNLLNYGKIYSRFPYDPIIKNHFYKLNREYSKLRKYKYKQYKQSLISQLDSLHEENPKLYWNLINELQEKNETKKKCGVQPSTLISHFQKLSQLKALFKGKKRKRGLKLTLYKKPWRYKLSPPSKRTKPSGSSPVVKYTSQRSPHIFKKSISPIKTSTPIYIRRNLFTQNHEIFENKKADIQNLLFTNIDESQDNLEEDHKEEHVLDNEEDIEEDTEEDHVVDHEKDHMEDLEEEYKVFQSALDKLSD